MLHKILSLRLYAGGILLLLLLIGQRGLAQEDKLLIRLSSGYEGQDFHWSIAGNSAGQDPNIYSELKWRNTGGPSGKVDLQWKPWGRWRVFASGSRVFTRSGSFTDTDYGLDNRYDAVYHQEFNVRSGYSEAASAGIGYSLLKGGRWQLTPFAGYGITAQYFPIVDPDGPFGQLNSSYSAKWLGPLVGADASWQFCKRWQVVANASYNQVKYHAVADWNLISSLAQPVSFRHKADGYGFEAEAGMRYKASCRLAVELRGGYFEYETGKGIDQLYLSTGGSDETQLNGVVREGYRAILTVEMRLF